LPEYKIVFFILSLYLNAGIRAHDKAHAAARAIGRINDDSRKDTCFAQGLVEFQIFPRAPDDTELTALAPLPVDLDLGHD
jgi:predicted nucleic acid-binding protein